MASYMIRGLPEGLIPRAKERARERGEKLDDVLIAILTKYAAGSLQSESTPARDAEKP